MAFKSDMKKASRKTKRLVEETEMQIYGVFASTPILAPGARGNRILRFRERSNCQVVMEVLTEKSVAKEGHKNEDVRQKGNNDC